jgi:hypothetical protein
MTQDPYALPPPMPKDPRYVPPPRDTQRPGPHIVAEVIPSTPSSKWGTSRDSPSGVTSRSASGGRTARPSPLGYFTVAVGF